MNQRTERKARLSVGVRSVTISIVIASIVACAQAPIRQQSPSIDDVIGSAPDPEMKAVWKEASARGDLPPMSAIPTPEQAVTRRSTHRVVADVDRQPSPRPLIPKDAKITVQAFSEHALSRYDGLFEIQTHEPGVIKGILLQQDQPFEIHYRLPETTKAKLAESTSVLNLIYREELVDNSLQKRIVLHDSRANRLSFIAIAEGDQEPVDIAINELGLVIRQSGDGENPPVIVSYGSDSVTLRQGESKSLGQLTVYLLNSYVRDKRFAFTDPGQPYFVNLIIYQ